MRMTDVQRAFFGAALFVLAWAAIHTGFYEHAQIVDTPVYEEYGDAIVDGAVPYRDFKVEYPPGALPVFVVPALGDWDYREAFEWVMALCGIGAIAGVALSARPLGLGFWTLAFVALSPLAIGSVILTRFDLWPVMLTSFALAAILREHVRSAHVLLGLAVAAKLYPGVFLPLTVGYVWRRRGRRDALICLALCVGVALAVYAPFVVVAPDGVLASVGRQLSRPLQIESVGSAFLLVAHQLFDLDLDVRSTHGSQNLVGTLPAVVAVLLSAAQMGALVWVWTRRVATPQALAAACAAALVAFVALGKVLSPQFLIWLVAVVPLAASASATAVLAVAVVLTQLWFPFRYWDLVRELDTTVSWLVLVRDLVLVGLLALLVRRLAATQR